MEHNVARLEACTRSLYGISLSVDSKKANVIIFIEKSVSKVEEIKESLVCSYIGKLYRTVLKVIDKKESRTLHNTVIGNVGVHCKIILLFCAGILAVTERKLAKLFIRPFLVSYKVVNVHTGIVFLHKRKVNVTYGKVSDKRRCDITRCTVNRAVDSCRTEKVIGPPGLGKIYVGRVVLIRKVFKEALYRHSTAYSKVAADKVVCIVARLVHACFNDLDKGILVIFYRYRLGLKQSH